MGIQIVLTRIFWKSYYLVSGFALYVGRFLRMCYSSNLTGFKDKRLWDWMKLLIVPVVLAAGALLFQNANAKVERDNLLDSQRQEALVIYFDRMETLLLDHNLRQSDNGSEVRTTARTRTLTVLRILDGQRKRYVLQLLYESDLINNDNPIISLKGADFSEANLRNAILRNTDLYGVDFRGANFERADLQRADLWGVNLERANLRYANLERANLSAGQLVNVSELSYAIMPDGAKYEDWLAHGKVDWKKSE